MDREKIDISPAEIRYSATIRRLDPNGRVFFYNGQVYRGIYPARVSFIQKLFDDGIVGELCEKGLMIGTRLTDMTLDGYGLVLEHDRADLEPMPLHWSLPTFISAARLYLDLYETIHRAGLQLIDGHHSNFSMTSGGKVVWHDFGSIIEHNARSLGGLQGFLENFYYPLMLYRRTGNFSIVRRLSMRCTRNEYHQLVNPRLAKCVQGIAWRIENPRLIKAAGYALEGVMSEYLRGTGWLSEGRRMLFDMAQGRRVSYRRVGRFIEWLKRSIDDTPLRFEKSQWSQYYKDVRTSLGQPVGSRQRAVLSAIKSVPPDRVLDLGANEGTFSHLAYQCAEVVIAADYDEAAVAKHSALLRETCPEHRIYPIILDITKVDERLAERLRSHTVLALAVTHHLRLGQHYSFDRIAELFDQVCEQCLITEFMPNGLGIHQPLPSPLPEDYTLEVFVESLNKRFGSAEVVDYSTDPGQSPRTLVVCRR